MSDNQDKKTEIDYTFAIVAVSLIIYWGFNTYQSAQTKQQCYIASTQKTASSPKLDCEK